MFYIVGEEPTSRVDELSKLLDQIIGDEDRSLVLESFDLNDAESDEDKTSVIENAVASLQSPPFLTSKRVVVIRDIGSATNDNVVSLINYLSDQLETSFFIAIQGGGRISAQLTKAWKPYVKQIGIVREAIGDVFYRLLEKYSLSFEPGLKEQILKHCGEDASKLTSVIERLHGVYGSNVKLSAQEVSSYLGESGNVAIYELANEICSGNTTNSLEILSRMLHSTSSQNIKPMHPLQILALVSNHFRKLATLDDKSIRNKNDAHAALDSKGNPYGAQKSWELSRSLGSENISACIELLADTDIAMKGANAIDVEIAIELLIISLCEVCSNPGEERLNSIKNQYRSSLYL